MKVVVVIPNWNGADLISECLASLEAQSYGSDILVVDNGSVDESVEIIKKRHPSVELIELPENTGFAGGVNVGIRYAIDNGYDAVALFNNDAVADKDWLKSLVSALDSRKVAGIVTSKFKRINTNYFDSTGDYYTIWGLPFPRGRNQEDTGQYNKTEEVFGASGGASLYRVEMLKEIGLFDEAFFAYYEDVDISFRAQLAGWKVFYQPKAVVYHHVSATSNKLGSFTRFHATKNFHILFLKNMPGWMFWAFFPLAVAQSGRLMLGSLAHGQLLTHMRGYLAAVKLIPYTLRERRKIQKNRKVPISYINSILVKKRPPKIPKI